MQLDHEDFEQQERQTSKTNESQKLDNIIARERERSRYGKELGDPRHYEFYKSTTLPCQSTLDVKKS